MYRIVKTSTDNSNKRWYLCVKFNWFGREKNFWSKNQHRFGVMHFTSWASAAGTAKEVKNLDNNFIVAVEKEGNNG